MKKASTEDAASTLAWLVVCEGVPRGISAQTGCGILLAGCAVGPARGRPWTNRSVKGADDRVSSLFSFRSCSQIESATKTRVILWTVLRRTVPDETGAALRR